MKPGKKVCLKRRGGFIFGLALVWVMSFSACGNDNNNNNIINDNNNNIDSVDNDNNIAKLELSVPLTTDSDNHSFEVQSNSYAPILPINPIVGGTTVSLEEQKRLSLASGAVGTSDVRYTYLDGYNNKVFYANINGTAYFEGDIVLGSTEEMEAIKAEVERLPSIDLPAFRISRAIVINQKGGYRLWPNNTIHYRIDPHFLNPQRITDAIEHIHANTNLRLVLRTNQANYVTFKNGNGCSAPVGMQNGEKFITLQDDANGVCDWPRIVHEIGHAAGLWHEQSRSDRDDYIIIHWDNIEADAEHNFQKRDNVGMDFGPYDYGSLMHYGARDFARDRTRNTITPKNSSATIGQRNSLSAGDIAAINALYPPPPPQPPHPSSAWLPAILELILD